MARLDARDLGGWEQDVASLAGSLVHEVKNPLSTLNINTQLIIEEWPEPESPREVRMVKRLQVMRAEVGRIEHIVDSFLRLVRDPEPEFGDVDVHAMLDDLLGANREALERAGITLRYQDDPSVGTVHGDESLLRQALLNLVRNAQQAMSDGGELIVQARPSAKEVEIEVTDTGEGIPPERLPRIFRPYFSCKHGGTGLGLSTTLRIAQLHGGSISVESEVGKGSCFRLHLPVSAPAARRAGTS